MHYQTSRKVPIKHAKGGPSFVAGGAIPFYYTGSSRPGLRLCDAASMSNNGSMAQANEIALPGHSSIRLHVTWPGYSNSAITVPINCQQSKAAFAVIVARHISAFLQKCASIPCSSSNAEWRVGQSGVSITKVVLVAVVQTADDIWQAELELEA